MLVGGGRLERIELAGQESGWHEMTFAAAEPLCNESLRALEVNQTDVGSMMREDVAIGALERRAADHHSAARIADAIDLGGNGLEPGPAVLVGQGVACAHLGDVAGRMELVGVLVWPAEPRCQRLADGGLARAGYAHQDQRARRLIIPHE